MYCIPQHPLPLQSLLNCKQLPFTTLLQTIITMAIGGISQPLYIRGLPPGVNMLITDVQFNLPPSSSWAPSLQNIPGGHVIGKKTTVSRSSSHLTSPQPPLTPSPSSITGRPKAHHLPRTRQRHLPQRLHRHRTPLLHPHPRHGHRPRNLHRVQPNRHRNAARRPPGPRLEQGSLHHRRLRRLGLLGAPRFLHRVVLSTRGAGEDAAE